MPPQETMGTMPQDLSVPPLSEGQQPISKDQYLELVQLFDKVKQASGRLHSTQFMIKNQAAQSRRDALKRVFDELAAAGVDLNNPESVATFIQKLQDRDPDLYQLFEEAMGQLLADNETNNEDQRASINEGVPGIPQEIRGPEASRG